MFMNPSIVMEPSCETGDGSATPCHASEMVGAVKEKLSDAAVVATDAVKQCGSHYVTEPAQDMFGLLKTYAKSNPDVVAMWCFGLGVVVGWKIKP